ncbi:hypothetical protein ACQKWADRAFT_292343 [Trichoderma austrokoningii]
MNKTNVLPLYPTPDSDNRTTCSASEPVEMVPCGPIYLGIPGLRDVNLKEYLLHHLTRISPKNDAWKMEF